MPKGSAGTTRRRRVGTRPAKKAKVLKDAQEPQEVEETNVVEEKSPESNLEKSAAYWQKQAEQARAEIDYLIEAGQVSEAKLKEMESVVASAGSTAQGLLKSRLLRWEGIDSTKTAWVVKANYVRDGMEVKPNGDISIPLRTGGSTGILKFSDGYAVTHDLELARSSKSVFNGRFACWELKR